MVNKCANPSCETRFLHFRGGKLFVFEPRDGGSLRVEHFWLCEHCAPDLTVVVDRDGHPHVKSVHCDHRVA